MSAPCSTGRLWKASGSTAPRSMPPEGAGRSTTACAMPSRRRSRSRPLPCWQELSEEARWQRIAEIVAEIEAEAARMREQTGRPAAGAHSVITQDPHARSLRPKKSRPLESTRPARELAWSSSRPTGCLCRPEQQGRSAQPAPTTNCLARTALRYCEPEERPTTASSWQTDSADFLCVTGTYSRRGLRPRCPISYMAGTYLVK